MATDKHANSSQQSHYSDLELAAHHPYLGIEVQTQQWGHTQSGVPISEEKQAHIPAAAENRRRVLGLTVPIFWSLTIALALIIAGAIGGGLGGGLSAKRGATSLEKPAQQVSDSGTVTKMLPIVIPTIVPTDGGCDDRNKNINGTTYTPLEKVNGNTGAMAGITLQGQASPQTFQQLCDTDYPDRDTDPGVHDLLSFFAATFEDCMLACALYNRQFQQNGIATKGHSDPGGQWYCTGVSIMKTGKFLSVVYRVQARTTMYLVPADCHLRLLVGGRCYLKHKDAPTYDFKNDTSTPTISTSGILIGGLS
ncbi:hypothetical protein PG991_011749 [Apiospora marii]|uniref:Uncharacterized protein n=1 Tax=Apiospora marii TaxID=335849 RepID=A0ABR1RG65_9PEZI